jgi:hypothetical protein
MKDQVIIMSTNVEKRIVKIQTGLAEVPIVAFKYEEKMDATSVSEILSKVADQFRKQGEAGREKALRSLISDQKVTFSQNGAAITPQTMGKDLAFSLQQTKTGTAMVAFIDANSQAQAGA